MAENAVEKAIREANEACQAAIMDTPLLYQKYIIFIQQNKRVGGSRQSPIFATIRMPYMSADGRVKMAVDEHKEAGEKLTITTHFEEVFGKPMCLCKVMSPIYGTRTAWAEVNPGGTGVDSTNPFSNGETSAIARALGFMGYGIFGMGGSQVDEMMNEQPAESVSMADASATTAYNDQSEAIDPASEKQLGFLYSLLKNVGIEEGHKRAYIGFMFPKGMGKGACSMAIETLKNKGHMPEKWQSQYFNFLVKNQGVDHKRIVDKMMSICKHSEPERLTTGDFVLVVESLKTNASDAPAPPSEPEQPELASTPDLNGLLKSIAKDCRIELGVIERWAIDMYGAIDSPQKQKDVFEKVRARDIDAIQSEIQGTKV